jgi:hypothetical protein
LGLAAVGWWWSQRRTTTPDPQSLPAQNPQSISLSDIGPQFVEDDPTDEIVSTLLSAEITRRPYSIRYQSGGTDLYMRFIDDELENKQTVSQAERRGVQIQ